MNSCLSYRDERIKNGVASPPLSIIVAIVIPSLPFVRCGKNQWRGPRPAKGRGPLFRRSEEHTSELQSLMRTSYAVFCLNKTKQPQKPKSPTPKKFISNTHI